MMPNSDPDCFGRKNIICIIAEEICYIFVVLIQVIFTDRIIGISMNHNRIQGEGHSRVKPF